MRHFVSTVILIVMFPFSTALGREWFSDLDLEPTLASGDLVVVARVTAVSEERIIYGGKGESVTQQFTFQPVLTIKGVFARNVLSLTNRDIGQWGGEDAKSAIAKDQLRLLILGRSEVGYQSRGEDPPLLGDEKDPLINAVQALLACTREHDRAKRATILLEALPGARGPGAVALMAALNRRAMLAALSPEAIGALKVHLAADSPAERAAAARTLRMLFDADYLWHPELHKEGLAALAAAIERPGNNLATRLAVFDSLGSAGPLDAAVAGLLQLNPKPSTLAESAARVRAAGRLRMKDQAHSAAAFFTELPLDVPSEVEAAAEAGICALQGAEAAKGLADRLDRKIAAGLDVQSELAALAGLPHDAATTDLLEARKMPLEADELTVFAQSARKVADPRLVPALSSLLDPHQSSLRYHAMEALLRIDTDDAARAVLPHLADERDLSRKLQLAGFLGRHGLRDGYAYALEHMSSPDLREAAVAALAAIREPNSIAQLRAIWQSSNDVNWDAASIRALGALGDRDSTAAMLELARDLKNPLAAPALVALGDLGEPQAISLVRGGLSSRKTETVIAAARAAAKLLAMPAIKDDAVLDQLAALLADFDAEFEVRSAALESLAMLGDPRLDPALRAAVLDAKLEGSRLMARIEQLMAERKTAVKR